MTCIYTNVYIYFFFFDKFVSKFNLVLYILYQLGIHLLTLNHFNKYVAFILVASVKGRQESSHRIDLENVSLVSMQVFFVLKKYITMYYTGIIYNWFSHMTS